MTARDEAKLAICIARIDVQFAEDNLSEKAVNEVRELAAAIFKSAMSLLGNSRYEFSKDQIFVLPHGFFFSDSHVVYSPSGHFRTIQ